MLTLVHRTATSRVHSLWEFDPQSRRVFATVKLGAAEPVHIDLAVCSDARPRHGAYLVTRLDSSTWAVAPAAYALEGGVWVARATDYHECVPKEFLELSHAPDPISLELAAL